MANKDFRGIVGSVEAPKPQWASRGNVPSPEQAPWHDVVVDSGTEGLGQIPGSHEVRVCVHACVCIRACVRVRRY